MSAVRARLVAAIALVAAIVGGGAVLLVASAAGWLHGGSTKTVVVRETVPTGGTAAAVVAARPLVGNGFQPAQIYRSRSSGVVTIISFFGSPEGSAGQGSGFLIEREDAGSDEVHHASRQRNELEDRPRRRPDQERARDVDACVLAHRRTSERHRGHRNHHEGRNHR